MKISFVADGPEACASAVQAGLNSIDVTSELTNDKIESWLVLRLLERLVPLGTTQFPLVVEGSDPSGQDYEKPDFRLRSGETQIGIEVTIACHRDQFWALSLSSQVDGAVVELSHFRPGHEIDRGSKVKPPIVQPGRSLVGRGWNGSEAEREWLEYIEQSIQDKHAKLLAGGYQRFDEDWLLISDRSPVSMFIQGHLVDAANMLNDRLKNSYWQEPDGYCQIFVRCGTDVIDLNNSGFRVLPKI